MTHKNIKGRTFFEHMRPKDPQKVGTIRHLCNHLRESLCAPSGILFTNHVFTENTIQHFSAFNNETKSDEDPQEILGPKKRVFLPNGLNNLHGQYVSTKNHMKCKTCLDAYGRSAKPSQVFVHGTTNFQQSALVRHQWGNDLAMAVEVIKQRKCHKKVMRHVEEKSSTALKAQVRT